MSRNIIPPSFGIKKSYADEVYSDGNTIWGDKITGNNDITITRKIGGETPVPPVPPEPTVVEFIPYMLKDGAVPQYLYIPTGDELQYFADAPISTALDPQPETLADVTISESAGVVYQGIKLSQLGACLFKNDNIILVSFFGSDEFTYNDITFRKNSEMYYDLSDIGIVGYNDGWTCSVNSIISNSSNLMFIGNEVSTPTV